MPTDVIPGYALIRVEWEGIGLVMGRFGIIVAIFIAGEADFLIFVNLLAKLLCDCMACEMANRSPNHCLTCCSCSSYNGSAHSPANTSTDSSPNASAYHSRSQLGYSLSTASAPATGKLMVERLAIMNRELYPPPWLLLRWRQVLKSHTLLIL